MRFPRLKALLFAAVAGVVAVAGVRYAQLGLVDMAPQQAAAVLGAAAASGDAPDATLQWVIAGGYALVFFGMMIEGPIVTAAAAFAASLGYFNIWAVLALSIAGDLTVDSCLFFAGRMLRTRVVERYGHRVGLSSARMRRIEQVLKTHPRKAIVAIKLTPLVPVPGLMLAGASKMPFRTFASTCLGFILPGATLFCALGFFFGEAYESALRYVESAEHFILIAIAATIAVHWIYKKSAQKLSRSLQTV
jgi:membrane protein DedA with SNARE-associated domain